MYVLPLTAKAIDQGVIVDNVYFYAIDDFRPGFVLTPTCDFAQNKCEYIQVCALFDAWEVLRELAQYDWSEAFVDAKGNLLKGPLAAGKKKQLASRVKELITRRFVRYHWLAPLPGTPNPRILDFQLVESAALEELSKNTILAELRSPFREEVPARYAAYMGRVGIDDFAQSDIEAWIDEAAQRIFPSS